MHLRCSGCTSYLMCRKLVFLCILITICIKCVSANDFKFSYANSNGQEVVSVKNKLSFNSKDLHNSYYTEYTNGVKGYRLALKMQLKHDFSNSWDTFLSKSYLTDEALGVEHREDSMFGIGYEFFNSYEHRHKLSYALISRAAKTLHSMRYKYTYKSYFIGSKLILFYILPVKEVKLSFVNDFTFSELIAFFVEYRYHAVDDRTSFSSLAGFKILY